MDLTVFRTKFKGDIVTPHDPDYEQAIYRWASNAKRRAAVVAFVKDEHDVSLAIMYYNARAAGLRIAIRGGGHSPAGTSSSEGGLVIDLSKYMNGVRIDPDQKLAYVQGGAMWGTLDEEAIKYGLAGVAGTVNDVSQLTFVQKTATYVGLFFRLVWAGMSQMCNPKCISRLTFPKVWPSVVAMAG